VYTRRLNFQAILSRTGCNSGSAIPGRFDLKIGFVFLDLWLSNFIHNPMSYNGLGSFLLIFKLALFFQIAFSER
jgi:hypothetical protein